MKVKHHHQLLAEVFRKTDHAFGGLGLLLGISGTLLGGYMGMKMLFFGVDLSNRPLFLLAESNIY